MKFRLTKSFLYSFFLHITIVLLLLVIYYMVKKDEAVTVQQTRCKVMLSQVCHCMPEKDLVKKPVVEKPKRPLPLKKMVKKKPVKTKTVKKVRKPVVKKEVVVKEKVVKKVAAVEPEPIGQQQEALEEEPKKELIVMPDREVALSAGAKKAIVAPSKEEMKPEDAYVKAHISEIMALLRKNLYYPRIARKRRIQGRVLVRFELLKNGDIQNIEVVESERDILARSAVTTIERLEGKFPLPDETLILDVPIMYHLN